MFQPPRQLLLEQGECLGMMSTCNNRRGRNRKRRISHKTRTQHNLPRYSRSCKHPCRSNLDKASATTFNSEGIQTAFRDTPLVAVNQKTFLKRFIARGDFADPELIQATTEALSQPTHTS